MLISIASLRRDVGDYPEFTRSFIRQLAFSGDRVTLLATVPYRKLTEGETYISEREYNATLAQLRYDYQGVSRIALLPNKNNSPDLKLTSKWMSQKSIPADLLAASNSFDVVFDFPESGHYVGMATFQGRSRWYPEARYVCVVHEPLSSASGRNLYNELAAATLPEADIVACIGNNVSFQYRMACRLGSLPETHTLIPGSHYESMDPRPSLDTLNFLITLPGRLDIPSLEYCLRAFGTIRNLNFTIDIAGIPESQRGVVENWANDLVGGGLARNVRGLGLPADFENLEPLLRRYHAIIPLTSESDFGLIALDSLGRGTPVLVSDFSETANFIRFNVSPRYPGEKIGQSFMVHSDIDDGREGPKRWAEAIRAFGADPLKFYEEAEKVREVIREFSWGNCVNALNRRLEGLDLLDPADTEQAPNGDIVSSRDIPSRVDLQVANFEVPAEGVLDGDLSELDIAVAVGDSMRKMKAQLASEFDDLEEWEKASEEGETIQNRIQAISKRIHEEKERQIREENEKSLEQSGEVNEVIDLS
ncbi:hypothetical protein ACH429_25675 [Streptomyces pathocidini]|uniref:Uncharacterized protein n=1 Tax=Streptomyces pathocidini TaxID=1650571 RepID=A0ABW7UXZ3_9ACTN|nr:hypothetical protein [Streptomyces pathocidini]